MKTIACLLLVLSIPSIVLCQEKLVRTNPTELKSVEFLGESYKLAFVNETATQGHREIINEYVLADESLERWTKLVAVYHYPNQRDLKAIPAEMIKALNRSNPLAKHAVHSNPENTKVMVDFITWDLTQKEKVTEFNVFIFQKNTQGPGIISQQFAMRAYGDEGPDFIRGMKEKRIPILEATTKFNFPAITSQQP